MKVKHHKLDIDPEPKKVLYVNEPEIVDDTAGIWEEIGFHPESQKDNIRIYVPLDINKKAILQRLDRIIGHYGEANESNEFEFESDVKRLLSQVEIYDQVWYVRHIPECGEHSKEAVELVKEFISILEKIPDGCAELFPFELIDELRKEYL